MAKIISFKIQLEGSKDVLKEIDKIEKRLASSLKNASIKVDGNAFDAISKSTNELKSNVSKAGESISQMTKRITQLRQEGKENTDEYKSLVDQVSKLRAEQTKTNQQVKKGQSALEAQANLQKLINGEIKAGELSNKQFFAALNAGLDKADPKYDELVQDFVRLKAEQKSFNDDLRQQQRLLDQGNDLGSRYARLNAELVSTRKALRGLTDAEIRSGQVSEETAKKFGLQTRSIKVLQGRVKVLFKELNNTDKGLRIFARNIGNYVSAFNGIANVVGVGFGASEIISGARQLISESTNLFDIQERADEQLRTVLDSTEGVAGRTLDQLKQFAQERQKVTLFGDEETQQLQALLLTFTNIQGDVFDRATVAVQDYSTALAAASGGTVDVRSASIQLGKALNDPIKGLTALGRSGVQFSDQQKELIQGFVETGELAQAQNVILEELERQFAGSAEAAARAGTGATKQLQNQISDIKEEIGGTLAPALEQATRLQLSFFKTIRDVLPFLVEYASLILKLATTIGLLVLRQKLLTAAQVEGSAAAKAYAVVMKLLSGQMNLASKATKGATNAFKGFTKAIKANPILAVVSVIAALIIGITELAKRNENVRKSLTALGDAFRRLIGLFQPVIDAFGRLFSAIGKSVSNTGIFDAVVRALSGTINLLSSGIDALVGLFNRTGEAARGLYDRFQIVRTVVDAVRNTFNKFIEGLNNIPSVFAGIGAAGRQLLSNVQRTFQRMGIQAELLQKRLQLAITFDDDKEADLNRQIEALRKQQDKLKSEGRSAGEAFSEAYTESLEQRTALAKIKSSQLEKEAGEAGGEAGDELTKKFEAVTLDRLNETLSKLQEQLQKTPIGTDAFREIERQIDVVQKRIAAASGETSKKLVEDRKKALENIRKLETGLISDEFDAEAVQATSAAESDISGLVGDPEQIRKQTALIKAQLGLSLSEIEKKRVASFSEVIERAKQAAANEIALLTGNPNEIAIQSEVIKQSLITQIEGITTDRNEAIDNAIKQAEARRDAEIAALTGSPEEIEANAVVIRQTYTQAINGLTETRKNIIAQDEAEINNLRRQIVQQFGGEIAADLEGASLAELQIAKDALDKRLTVLDTELQALKQSLRTKAELKKAQLAIELQSGVSPERAQEIAKQLKEIDDKLKEDILKGERNTAKERLKAVKAIVPEALTEAERLAQAEIAIGKDKNEKLLADTRARVEAQKALEEEIKESLIDGAFEISGAFANSIVEADKQQLDEQIRIQKERSDAQAESQKESTKAFYDTQIKEAEGNTERQEELRQELSDKLVAIDQAQRNRERQIELKNAREQKKIARKQALINAALAATKTLATLSLPAGIPALIALSAATTALLIQIDSQKFEKGTALSNGVERYIADTYEAGEALSAPDINGSSAHIPNEGIIRGKLHKDGGVPATFNGTSIEVEKGEYKLRNGDETYIINRKSTKLFRNELDSLKGNTRRFDPAKREAASRINSFRGNGVKFASGGLLGVGAVKPLGAPVRLQNISGGVTREELSKAITGVYTGVSELAMQLDRKTDTIATEIQRETAAINSRIDRLTVYTDPVDIVNKGNERKQAQTAGEL